MVKALVLGYTDIIEPVNLNDQNYYIRVQVKFFDSSVGRKDTLTVDVLIQESDNQAQVETKIADAIVEGVTSFGSTLLKGDVLMIPFKRGA